MKKHINKHSAFSLAPADELCENVAKIITDEAAWQAVETLLNHMQTHRIMKFMNNNFRAFYDDNRI